MRLEPIAPHCIVEFPAPSKFVFVAPAHEDEVFRAMRDAYLASHVKYNGCMLTLNLCADGFGIPVTVLRGRQRGGGIEMARAKLMAFSRVVSLDGPCPNSLISIARAFHRTHPNVIYCMNRYGADIAAALEK